MKLYEINNKIEEIINNGFFIDDETGEYFDSSALDELEIEKNDKIEAVLLMSKNLKAEAEMIKAEKDTLQKRQQSAERRAEWLKEYVAEILKGEKFKTSKVEANWRKSEVVDIRIDAKLPEEYLTYKDPTPNKTEIKKALKNGIEIEGVSLITKNNMSIK